MNNRPITARVKSGMFKTKEPLLNVGPAGVDGNNQTRSMPSPSKMKGYAMKSSPFKQKIVYEVNKDGKLTAKKTTTETTPAVTSTNGSTNYESNEPGTAPGGKQATDLKKYMEGLYNRMGDDITTDQLIKDKYIGEEGRSAYDGITGGKNKGVATVTPGTDGKDEETKVFEQKADPMRKVEGEASTAFASRNNIRRGTQANRKTKKAEIKNAKSKAKGGAYYKSSEPGTDGKTKRVLVSDLTNKSSRELRKEGRIAKRDQKKLDREAREANPDLSAKEQRKERNTTKRKVNADAKVVKRKAKADFKGDKSKAKADQNERNYQLAKSESEASQEQSTQRKTGFSQNKTIRTTDVGKTGGDVTDDNKLLDGAPKVDVTPKKENTDNPQGATMKSSGFFKKKSPMKMNYFKK